MEITVQQLNEKIKNKDNFVLIDVREDYEYEEFNINGQHIPLGNLMAELPNLEQYKDADIVVHCRSGKRSAMAQEVMLQAGFKDVKNLIGGVIAWQEAF